MGFPDTFRYGEGKVQHTKGDETVTAMCKRILPPPREDVQRLIIFEGMGLLYKSVGITPKEFCDQIIFMDLPGNVLMDTPVIVLFDSPDSSKKNKYKAAVTGEKRRIPKEKQKYESPDMSLWADGVPCPLGDIMKCDGGKRYVFDTVEKKVAELRSTNGHVFILNDNIMFSAESPRDEQHYISQLPNEMRSCITGCGPYPFPDDAEGDTIITRIIHMASKTWKRTEIIVYSDDSDTSFSLLPALARMKAPSDEYVWDRRFKGIENIWWFTVPKHVFLPPKVGPMDTFVKPHVVNTTFYELATKETANIYNYLLDDSRQGIDISACLCALMGGGDMTHGMNIPGSALKYVAEHKQFSFAWFYPRSTTKGKPHRLHFHERPLLLGLNEATGKKISRKFGDTNLFPEDTRKCTPTQHKKKEAKAIEAGGEAWEIYRKAQQESILEAFREFLYRTLTLPCKSLGGMFFLKDARVFESGLYPTRPSCVDRGFVRIMCQYE